MIAELPLPPAAYLPRGLLAEIESSTPALRLDGADVEFSSEVLLEHEGQQYLVSTPTRSLPAAIRAAVGRFPGATVLTARRRMVVIEEEEITGH
ncbi:hypothetical protein [Luteolibacter sp. Populi]|uniref:hypothetical protein n=1 Tax=Luteolibacter sp. Populi TaxID=3230487 RepID=UPI00346518D1